MSNLRNISCAPGRGRQQGMVLLVALVMLLLITMIGVSSMQNATMQEKMANSAQTRNTTFQAAEAALRVGENAVAATSYSLTACSGVAGCAPPPASDYNNVTAAGVYGTAGITWVAVGTTGFYGVQLVGTTSDPVNNTSGTTSASLYRITAIGFTAVATTNPRSVVESIYVK